MLKAQGFTEIKKVAANKNKGRFVQPGHQPSISHPQKTGSFHPQKEYKKTELKTETVVPVPEITETEWQAPAYEFREKSPDWYWAVGIITVATLAASFFARNYLFGIFALLAGFSIAVHSARRPEIVTFKINSRGIKIGKLIYDYENLKNFWINYNPPRKKELLIESSKAFVNYIVIPLGHTDPVQIREILLPFLREKKIEEPLVSVIANLIGI